MWNTIKLWQIKQDGATDGQVITWDNALSKWKAATPSGGGSSSGISGAVQFSGGSGTFSSDATNFFFNDSTNQLRLNGGTTYQLLLAGQNGGLDSTPASAVTGAYNAFRSNTSATGYVNILLNNTNSSSATAHARVSLTTVAGGGDPFINLSTAEAGYVIGVDNSDSDKLYIGVGIDPSTMTSANITISADMTGIMQTAPTAILHLGAGTTADAPLKFTSGTNLTTPQAGAVEWDGTRLYVTQTTGPTRKTIAFTSDVTGVADGDYGDVTVSGTGTVWTVDSMNFNKLANASNTGLLDNTNYAQTWNWSTLSTANGLSLNAAALTTGSNLVVSSSNASLNSTGGLLYVNNGGASTSGTVFKVTSNGNIAGIGFIVKANGTVGVGTLSPSALLHLGGTPEIANGSTNGMFLRVDPSGLTDSSTAASGTVTHTAVSAFNTPQLFANNTNVTYTNASTLYIGGAPTAGTNVTITNGFALWVNGAFKLDLGSDATGDIYYRNSSGKFTRLAAGSDGTALTLSGGVPAWTANAVGDVSGPASSVDSEIALFSGTNGKVIKRATGTGVAIVTSGVLSTKTNPSGAFVGDTDTQTITNKRVNPRVTSTTSSSTPTPNADTDDIYILTALAAGATFGSPTGTPVNGQRLLIRVKDNGTARTLAYNAIYRAIGVTLPTTTVISKTLYLGCIYNSADTKWDVLAVGQEA